MFKSKMSNCKSAGVAQQLSWEVIWKKYGLLILILILASFLRLFLLGHESLWADELASLRSVRIDLENRFSINRILYFLILKFWLLFGDSESWLRLPSVIFGVISVFLVYLLGAKLFDKTTGLIAALLLTLSPLAIFHSQEVRMYMLSVFICLAGTLAATYYFLHRELKYAFLWLTLRILAILTTPINVLLIVPDVAIWSWLILKKRNLWHHKRSITTLLLSAVALSLLLFSVLYPSIKPIVAFLKVRQEIEVELTFVSFIGGIARLTVWPLASPLQRFDWFYAHFFNLYGIALVFLILASFFARQIPYHKILMALWGLMPLGILFLACKLFAPVLWGIPRYTVFAAPYIFILLALGITRIWHWKRKVALIIITMYFFAVSGSLWHYYSTDRGEDWQSVFQTIHRYEQSHDVITAFPPGAKEALDYYYKGKSPIYLIDDTGVYPNQSEINLTLDNFFSGEEFNLNIKPNLRIWFILRYAHTGIALEDREIFTQRISQELNIDSHYKFSGVEVISAISKN